MYNVSTEYLEQRNKHRVQNFKLHLTITLANGQIIDFGNNGEEYIKKDSLTIQNQCSQDNEVKLGAVYIGQLNVILLDCDELKGIDLYEAELEVKEGLYIESLGKYQYVPMGIYNIADIENVSEGYSVTAYDNMAKFDEPCDIVGFSTDYTAADISLMNEELNTLKELLDSQKNLMLELEAAYETSEAELNVAELKLKQSQEELKDAKSKYDKGEITEAQYKEYVIAEEEAKRSYDSAKTQYNSAKTDYETATQNVAESTEKILALQAEINEATAQIQEVNSTSYKLYSWASMACKKCGVKLFNKDFAEFPNSVGKYHICAKHDIDTYRDLIFWVAQSIGAFATINRKGQLEFRSYYREEIADNIDSDHRYTGASISGYLTRYSSMTVVDVDENKSKTYNLKSEGISDNALRYNLGNNPFCQDRTMRENFVMNILREFVKYNGRPFDMTVQCGAFFDLGDKITFSDGIVRPTTSKHGTIMQYTWNYNQSCNISGYGANPKLSNAKSKTDKSLGGYARGSDSNEVRFYTFENVEQIQIGNGESATICNFSFGSNDNGYAVYMQQVVLKAYSTVEDDTYPDIVAKVTYIHNNSEIETYHPVETWRDGEHILNLQYTIPFSQNEQNHWQTKLSLEGGRVVIPAFGARATLFGQSLSANDEWDGLLLFEDEVAELRINSLDVTHITDSLNTHIADIAKSLLSEQVSELTLNSLTIDTLTASMIVYRQQLIDIDVNYPVEYDSSNVSIRDNTFVVTGAAPQYIDAVLINTTNKITNIGNIDADMSNVTLMFGNADRWYVFASGDWIQSDAGMTLDDVKNITSAQWMKLAASGFLKIRMIMENSESYLTSLHFEYMEGAE